MWRRWSFVLGTAAVAAATVAIRIPAYLANRHIDFDEGVYGVSVLAMRDGALPFRDVFSSQGPLFLPLLWLFDVLGLRHFRAVRLGMVLVAVAFALGVLVVARRATAPSDTSAALVAAAVVGTSAAGIAAAGPIHSDGIALAFGVWAIAVLLGAGRLGRWRPIVVGLLLGAAVAVKSLFVLPAVLAVAWRYVRDRSWAELSKAVAAAAALGLIVSLPWGLSNVWDQFVVFQLDAERDRAWWSNIHDSLVRMWTRDIIFVVVAALGLLVLTVRLVARRPPVGDRSAQAVVVVWLIASLALLVFGTQLSRGTYRFLILLIAPAMVAFALVRPPRIVTGAALLAGVALMPLHLNGTQSLMTSQQPTAIQAEIIARFVALPPGALVISDDPGVAWAAGRHPPPSLVDTSWARIVSGHLSVEQVLIGAAHPEVCAVLFYSHRFDFLDRSLDSRLDDYELAAEWDDDRRLFVKPDCAG